MVSKVKVKVKEQVSDEKATEDIVVSQEGKVGTMLHDVRVKKKIDIEDVSKVLCIKTSYLSAIEQSDYDHIPGYPYGVGFVRSYAEYLGLNSVRLVQMFKEESRLVVPEVVLPPISEPSEEAEIYIPNKKYILISIGLLILIYLLWSLFSSDGNTVAENVEAVEETAVVDDYPLKVDVFEEVSSETVDAPSQVTATEESVEEVVPQQNLPEQTKLPSEPVAEKVVPVSEKTETTNQSSANRVVLKVKKETWVEVKDDNKLWISKVLNAGDEYVLPEGGKGKIVSFGNTDGVDVLIDGKVVTIVSNNKKTNINMDAFLGNH